MQVIEQCEVIYVSQVGKPQIGCIIMQRDLDWGEIFDHVFSYSHSTRCLHRGALKRPKGLMKPYVLVMLLIVSRSTFIRECCFHLA